MKRKLTKQEYEALADALKEHYKVDGDNYTLQLDDDDLGALKRAKEHEKAARQAAEQKLRDSEKRLADIEARLDDDRNKAARSKGDVDALEKSWSAKLQAAQAEAAKKADELRAHLNRLLVDNIATNIAADISTSPDLILPHIKARLAVDEVEGKPTTRVLDSTGNPSALSVDELKQEFVADKRFSAIIVGSKAKGGGAPGGGGAGGSDMAQFQNEDGSVNWSKVAKANAKDPTVLDKVKETLASSQPAMA